MYSTYPKGPNGGSNKNKTSISNTFQHSVDEEDRNPSEDSSHDTEIPSDDSSSLLPYKSSKDSSSSDEEGSVLSATSAFVPLTETDMDLVSGQKFRSRSITSKLKGQTPYQSKPNSSSLQSALQMDGNDASKLSPKTTKREISMSQRVGMQRVSTRAASPSKKMSSIQKAHANIGTKNLSVDELKQESPFKSIKVKPPTTYFNTAHLSDDSSSIDSQEMYALTMAGASNASEEDWVRDNLGKNTKRGNQLVSFDTATSIDSQEAYALRMTYGHVKDVQEQLQKDALLKQRAMEQRASAVAALAKREKKRRAAEKAERDADEIRKAAAEEMDRAQKEKERRAAEKEKRIAEEIAAAERAAAEEKAAAEKAAAEDMAAVERAEKEKLASEKAAAETKQKEEKEVAATQDEMAKRIEEQKAIEAKAEALEKEAELAGKSKVKTIIGNRNTYRPGTAVTFNKATKKATIIPDSVHNDTSKRAEFSRQVTGITVSRRTIEGDEEISYKFSDYSTDSDNVEGNDEGGGDTDGEVSDESSQDESVVKELVVLNDKDDNSVESDVSSMSGSDDDDDDDDDKGEQEVAKAKKKKRSKKAILRNKVKKSIGNNKYRRETVVASKGLKKGAAKLMTTRVMTKTQKGRTGKEKTTKTRKTMKTMKTTTLRAKKNKVKKKKTSSQMITIRQKGTHALDDNVSVTTDANTKVMRVCKLTSQGYISAEFKSVDPLNTPLHIACLTHYPEKFVINHLMKSSRGTENHKAVFKENSNGELPIHYAVMDKLGVPQSIFEALLKEYPESIQYANVDGSLPIHVACEVGAPSLYSIKRLCKEWPGSILIQNDLRVPLFDREEEIKKILDAQSPFVCCYDMFGITWFGGNEKIEFEDYETGWSPLHLASMNGADPEVIETLLETDTSSLLLKTNKNRTPLECAKWCIINGIINDVPVTKLQNTFASIQIMQSYDHDLKVKDELTQKVGLIKNAKKNSESYGMLWEKTVGIMPKPKKSGENITTDGIGDGEVGLTDLHRAIFDRNQPEDVQAILEQNPDCLTIMSSHDRTAVECAKHIIIKGLLLGENVSTLTNTFVSLEIMQVYDEKEDDDSEVDASQESSKAVAKSYKEKGESKFGSKADNFNYTKQYLSMEQSALGEFVKADFDAAIQPHKYYPPANLSHINLRLTIPVGFRRFRRAFLNSKQTFLSETVLKERMGYKK